MRFGVTLATVVALSVTVAPLALSAPGEVPPTETSVPVTSPPEVTAPTSDQSVPPSITAAPKDAPQSTAAPVDESADFPSGQVKKAAGPWAATKNLNATVVAGKMRSDREEIPGGFTKADADLAETMEAELLASNGKSSKGTVGVDGRVAAVAAETCQVYWPSPYQVCGAIRDKYNAMGGPGSWLSWPQSPQLLNPDSTGKRQNFIQGAIYWHPTYGAHPVTILYLNKWQAYGFEAGWMGYPKTDEIRHPDGGSRQEFVGGNIYWFPAGGIFEVHGAILAKYVSTGGATGFLGYPVGEETTLPDGQGKRVQFQNGFVYWSSAGGAHPVFGGIFDKWGMTNNEAGPYGYPIGDQHARAGGAALAPQDTGDQDQEFQRGTISIPTTNAAGEDIDWAEDYIDENTCDACGNDDRIAVAGPAYTQLNRLSGKTLAPDASVNHDGLTNPVQQCSMHGGGARLRICSKDETSFESIPASIAATFEPSCQRLPFAQWGGDRTHQCMWRTLQAQVFADPEATVLVGTVDLLEERSLETKWNRTAFTGRSTLHILDVDAEGRTVTIDGYANCRGDICDTTGQYQFTNFPAVKGTQVTIDYTLSTNPTGTSFVTPYVEAAYQAHSGTLSGPPSSLSISPNVRCDASGDRNSAGCVFPTAEPILDYSTRGVPALAQHVRRAQATGLLGTVGGTPLTRTTNTTTIQSNRNSTCNRVPGPRPSGKDCDEYPFAATTSGGSSGGVRTYTDCEAAAPGSTSYNPNSLPNLGSSGVSLCLISSADNRRGGGILTWFYAKNRLRDGERFYVKG